MYLSDIKHVHGKHRSDGITIKTIEDQSQGSCNILMENVSPPACTAFTLGPVPVAYKTFKLIKGGHAAYIIREGVPSCSCLVSKTL